jgi:hypothetical protein
MDLSKLPRLSKTGSPAPPADSDPAAPAAAQPGRRGAFCDQCGAGLRPGARFCDSCGAPVAGAAVARPVRVPDDDFAPGAGPEVWISIALGLLLLFLAPNAMKWASSKVLHTKFTPYVDPITEQPVDYVLMTDGTKVNYRNRIEFWNDWAITAFALALILEGVALVFSRRPLVVLLALLVTVAATLANLIYLVATYNTYGIALLSALAVIFGTVIAVYEWRLLMMLVAAQRQGRV